MKAITLAIAAAFLFSGCVLVPARMVPARSRMNVDSDRDDGCRPNEYRDGNICRHKGKGHGARKHDRVVD
jgi:hypothetical protein